MDRQKLKWFGISFLFLGLIAFLADFRSLVNVLREASPYYFLIAVFFGILPFFVWSFTWYRFINKVGLDISYQKVVPLFLGGNFLNSITPLGQFGGEPLMAFILDRNTDLSYEKAFAAVFSSDILNFLPVFTFTIAGGLYYLTRSSINGLIQDLVFTGLAIAVIGGFLTYLLWFRAGTIEKIFLNSLTKVSSLTDRTDSLVEKVERKLLSVEDAFNSIGEEPVHLLVTAAVAHLAFIFNVVCLYFSLLSIGFSPNSWILIFVLPLSTIATISPTPGGSGTYEATMAFVLTVFTPVGLSQGLAAAIIFRASTYWPSLLIGYAALTRVEASK